MTSDQINTTTREKKRAPGVFNLSDTNVILEEPERDEIKNYEASVIKNPANTNIKTQSSFLSWSSLFFTSLVGLIIISLGIWMTDLVTGLIAREDGIGWASIILLSLFLLATFVMALREIYGLIRLRKASYLRDAFVTAHQQNDKDLAQKSVEELKTLLSQQQETLWGLARLQDYQRDILTAEELLILTEREVIQPIDIKAQTVIAKTAQRISVITAISPIALVDVFAVAYLNLKMIHQIAALYGCRPGGLGVLRLTRMVVTHLTLTGGVALTSDALQQFISQKLSAKLSAKLGEGIFNGAMCARIGIATLAVCRPLPYIQTKPPRFRDFLSRLWQKQEPKNKNIEESHKPS